MATLTLSEYARARRIAASVKKTRPKGVYSAGYVRQTIKQCPKHHVEYVLRRGNRADSAVLMYDCPEEGCFNSLQVSKK